MKSINKVLVALLFFFIITLPVNALDTSDKVHDNADLLTDYEESQLQELAEEYIEKYDMDLVIVTTLYNDGKGTDLYAMDFICKELVAKSRKLCVVYQTVGTKPPFTKKRCYERCDKTTYIDEYIENLET